MSLKGGTASSSSAQRRGTSSRRRRRIRRDPGDGSDRTTTKTGMPLLAVGFLIGCLVSSTFYLGFVVELPSGGDDSTTTTTTHTSHLSPLVQHVMTQQNGDDNNFILNNKRILVAIASFDFSQWPHLEDVLDGYADIAYGCSGCLVHIVIHTTIPYPLPWIDLLNSRYKHLATTTTKSVNQNNNNNTNNNKSTFQITLELAHPSIRLHLVDLHRKLFYDEIQNYDLFIYTEDDIRVTSRTIASYLLETQDLQQIVGISQSYNYNVGIVRYEYNFPSNVLMDDKTRHATQNVTRVYWEHSSHVHPAMPESVDRIPQQAAYNNNNKQQQQLLLLSNYVHMKNHHQGMYIATPDLLQAWKEKESCHFHVVTNRPGRGNQPTEGTQRVWMSSQQLYGSHHCNIQQILPIHGFTSLTVWHLPNKNYRRVGKFRKRQFSDGTEVFETPPNLLTEMDLHVELYEKGILGKKMDDATPPHYYRGVVQMTDKHLDRSQGWGRELLKKLGTETDYYNMVERRMKDYQDYVSRGGILTKEDLTKTDLVDIVPRQPPS